MCRPFRFYEYCSTKLIEGVSSLNYKDIFKSVVSLDKIFNLDILIRIINVSRQLYSTFKRRK